MFKNLKTLIKKDLLFSLLIFCGLVFFLIKLYHLSYQSLWMDEGFYVLAAQKILKHGYPIYPSGHVLFKGIFYSYSLAAFSSILGQNLFIYRLFSLIIHILTPIVFYKLSKNSIKKNILFASAILLFLFTWETEYARSALYYSLLQFLFSISIILFIRNRIFDEKKGFAVPWIMTSLTHQLGMGLVFNFPTFLLMYPRKFFKKKNLISLIFWIPFFFIIMFQEVLFWKVGQVYANQSINDVGNIFKYFFKKFNPVYFKLLSRSHPYSFKIFLFGLLIFLCYIAFKKLYKKKDLNRFEITLLFLNLSFIFIIFGLGIMKTHPMPRYLFPFHYIYIIIVVSFLYFFVYLASKYLKILKKQTIFIPILLLISYMTFSQAGFGKTKNIIFRDYVNPVQTDIIYTSGRLFPIDHRTVGEYTKKNLKINDIVIAIHMIYQHLYVGKVNYWLFTGGPGTWDAWENVKGEWRDVYLGIPWINSLNKLKRTITQAFGQGKRVWIISSPSESIRSHITSNIQIFLQQNYDKIKWISRDGISKVYLFSPSQKPQENTFYEAEWGIYHKKDYLKEGTRSFVKISRGNHYKTALIFKGNKRKKITFKFKLKSEDTIIEVSILRNGMFESKRFFNVREDSITKYLIFQGKGRYGIKLKHVNGPPVFLDYINLYQNE